MINEERAFMQKDKTLHELYAKIRENQLQRFMRALKQADSGAKGPRKREAVLQVPALRELVRVHSDNGITGSVRFHSNLSRAYVCGVT